MQPWQLCEATKNPLVKNWYFPGSTVVRALAGGQCHRFNLPVEHHTRFCLSVLVLHSSSKKPFWSMLAAHVFISPQKWKNIWFDLIWLWFAVLESLVFMWTLMVCNQSMTWSAISLCHITDIWKYLSLGSVVVWSTLSGWLEELNLVLLSWPLQCFREDNFQPETLVWGDEGPVRIETCVRYCPIRLKKTAQYKSVKLCTSTTAVAQCCLISISNNLCNAWFCTLFP